MCTFPCNARAGAKTCCHLVPSCDIRICNATIRLVMSEFITTFVRSFKHKPKEPIAPKLKNRKGIGAVHPHGEGIVQQLRIAHPVRTMIGTYETDENGKQTYPQAECPHAEGHSPKSERSAGALCTLCPPHRRNGDGPHPEAHAEAAGARHLAVVKQRHSTCIERRYPAPPC